MKPSLVLEAMMTCIKAREPFYLRGAPGIGKTSLFYQVAAALGGWDVKITRLALSDSVDMRGLPDLDRTAGLTRWLPPEDFPAADCGPTLWGFDEWTQGFPSVQNAAGQILNEGAIGGYTLPKNVALGAAGNSLAHRAATNRMPTHIADRFTFLDVEFDLDDWSRQMIAVGCPTEVIAFGRFRPALISAFNPQLEISPTPRGWEKVGRLLAAQPSRATEIDIYKGKVGEGAALEFIGFLRIFRQLPSIDGIMLNPTTADLPNEPAALYAIAGALARKCTGQNFDRAMIYANRMPKEYGVIMVRDAVRRDKTLLNTRAFVEWASVNSDIMQ